MEIKSERIAGAVMAAVAVFVSAPAGAIVVGSAAELAAAVDSANAGGDGDIALRDGTYTLGNMLWIDADGVTVRSSSGDRDKVTIEGRGMRGGVTHIFNVNGADFTVRDMTLRDVANHAVQLQVDVDGLHIRNCHILDTNEQMVKAAYDNNPDHWSDDGLVEYCLFEYSAGIGPQYYIGGIDAHHARNWIVRGNVFRGIRSPGGDVAEYAVHFWSDSRDTLVENNYIINCDRGIGFGMGDSGHQGGVIRNNMIYHDSSEGFADVGISVDSCPDARIYNNTIFQEHGYSNAIEYRFPESTGVLIANNLVNRAISDRDEGGAATLSHNVTDAESGWFAHLFVGDLHLGGDIPTVVDQGEAVAGLAEDIDGGARPHGGGYDIGADEYGSGSYEPIPGPQPGGAPVPRLLVNGSGGTVTVFRGDLITAVVSLDPGDLDGVRGDWWMAAETPSGFYYYTFSGWTVGTRPAHQGALFALGSYEVFSIDSAGLSPGTYTVYFGIDSGADGAITWSSLVHDSVIVEIEE